MTYFIIIYGMYGITYSKGPGGQFPCPGCQGVQAYRHRRVRRFFHIFFIPLIPLNLAGEYVECSGCRQTFRMDILEAARALNAAPVVSESNRATRRLLVLMMLADGRIEESEIATIIAILSHAENRQVTRDEVLAEIEAARREPDNVEAFCQTAMGYLNESGRQQVLQAAQQVAGADGFIDPSEQRLLERIGIALGMRPGQVSTSLTQPGPAAPTGSSSPFCPQCGARARWHAEHNRWGCDGCRVYLPG